VVLGQLPAVLRRGGYRCLTPLLRHHDVDPKDKPHPELGCVSLLDYADDLEKEIRTLDEKPVIIGHSMGGLLTQILEAADWADPWSSCRRQPRPGSWRSGLP